MATFLVLLDLGDDAPADTDQEAVKLARAWAAMQGLDLPQDARFEVGRHEGRVNINSARRESFSEDLPLRSKVHVMFEW